MNALHILMGMRNSKAEHECFTDSVCLETMLITICQTQSQY